jgi:hypothetical protein
MLNLIKTNISWYLIFLQGELKMKIYERDKTILDLRVSFDFLFL